MTSVCVRSLRAFSFLGMIAACSGPAEPDSRARPLASGGSAAANGKVTVSPVVGKEPDPAGAAGRRAAFMAKVAKHNVQTPEQTDQLARKLAMP